MGFHPGTQRSVGLKFYEKDGAVVLQTGLDWVANGFHTHTVNLDDGERVIGYKSKIYFDSATHYDLQLIIGRLVWLNQLIHYKIT